VSLSELVRRRAPGLEEHFLSLAHAWRTFYEMNDGLLRCQPLIPSSRVRRSTVPDRVESQSRTRPPYMGFSHPVTVPGSSVAEPATPGQIRSERAAQSAEILELGPELFNVAFDLPDTSCSSKNPSLGGLPPPARGLIQDLVYAVQEVLQPGGGSSSPSSTLPSSCAGTGTLRGLSRSGKSWSPGG
jgi:hypothetical protein